MADLDTVIERIDAAFGGIERPGDQSLIVDGNSPEALQVGALLRNRRWPDIDTATLDAYDDWADLGAIIAFLSPEAAVYFMPAFLKYVIAKGPANGLLLRNMMRRFARSDVPFVPSAYSIEQRDAISAALAHLERAFERDDEIDLALVRDGLAAWNKALQV